MTVFASFEDVDIRNLRLQVVNVETGRLERNVEANDQGEISLKLSLNDRIISIQTKHFL